MEEEEKKEYEEYVKQITPKYPIGMLLLRAFICGGIICVIGQFIINMAIARGIEAEEAGSICSMLLVLAGAVLTGFNIYPSIVKWGGAGALVPISGFANSVAAPAIEYKAEGFVLGLGCKIFIIAGPVILYGILSSWALGIIYWILI
ncbi:MAG: SpoVA/SpoVAEb family sporulation membrane protein [Lachnospiraceae bacterium]